MAFPVAHYVEAGEHGDAGATWAQVANEIVAFEPVTMVVDPSRAAVARRLLDDSVSIVERPLDDSWMRDIGPTFVLDEAGALAAVTWTFNGWGAQRWARWGHDAAIGREVAALARAPVVASALVAEGGGIHVDGAGLAMTTETVLLDPERNGPTWSKEACEAELRRLLGVTRVLWLPRGLTADYGEFGTRGHVDMVAAFVAPGTAVVHRQPDATHPDHAVGEEAASVLAAAGVTVVPIDAPRQPEGEAHLVDWSYVNFYVGNGFVLVGTFGQRDADDAAIETLGRLFAGRVVRTVDARPIFAAGGGIHCITQQEPAPISPGATEAGAECAR